MTDPWKKTPLEQQLPPTNVASPSELKLNPRIELRWYKPDWKESFRLMGWRWMYFIPAIGVLAAMFILAPLHPEMWVAIISWWKIGLILVALPLGVAINAATHAIRLRKEPFCIHCGYDLTGLPDGHTCPECGMQFDLRVIEEYRRDPRWFIERLKHGKSLPVADKPFAAGENRVPTNDGT